MNRLSIFAATAMISSAAWAQTQAPFPADTNAPAAPKTISVQEMLVMGPSPLKLHSLAMITQGKVKGEIDASYLPGFKACSEDSAVPVRSVAARLLGEYFIVGKKNPNPEVVALLVKLSSDESSDVRHSAVYYGLTQIENKSGAIVELLVDFATRNREFGLSERIAESLAKNREEVIRMLDKKLKDGDNIAVYEIYEDLTGKKPANAEKYLEMPSSRPRLFIFKGEGADAEAYKTQLEAALKAAGIENHNVKVSGAGDNYVLLLKTYITKDHLAVEKAFSDNPKFKITQVMWLSPELEIQINAMQRQ